jgi:hypothetical protein
MRGENEINKIRNRKGVITTNPRKSRKTSGTTLKTHIQITWKI